MGIRYTDKSAMLTHDMSGGDMLGGCFASPFFLLSGVLQECRHITEGHTTIDWRFVWLVMKLLEKTK